MKRNAFDLRLDVQGGMSLFPQLQCFHIDILILLHCYL